MTPQPELKTGNETDNLAENDPMNGIIHFDQTSNSHTLFLQGIDLHQPEITVPPAVVEGELPTDLFSALFKSQSQECAWRALLAYAIALQRPLLAVLAACHRVSERPLL